ncbi:MAG: AmmeMemoRadiSam system protein B [Acidobacteriota bacterium]|nr:MAG: AmmeMemoRadiSam system protein B [Acidobacteriota bacterium]
MTEPRASQIAGTWYPGDPDELRALVERSLTDAPRPANDVDDIPAKLAELVALVVPHAGLIYSGRIAAAGYRLLEGARFDAVVLLGPCHRGGVGLAVLPDGAIETPLGTVRIDEELASALAEADPSISAARAPHQQEHSLEVQFPFLQRFLPNVPVVPVLMGFQTLATIGAAARALQRVIASSPRTVLMIASSDLSHYESRAEASRLDGMLVRCLEQFDVAGLERLLETNPHHACGGGPMVAVLTAARALGANAASVLAYGDSGDVTGDTDGVVGYVSAAIHSGAT